MARRPGHGDCEYLMHHFGIPDPEIAQSIIDSCTRFPNARGALEDLRRIGSPLGTTNISQPNTGFQSFVRILEALWIGMIYDGNSPYRLYSTFASIKQNWPAISSWIVFSMEHLVLTAETSDTAHRLLWILPLFLKLEGASQSVMDTRNATLNLRQLIGRVWCASIERNHPSWGRWSELFVMIEAESLRRAPGDLTEFRARVSTFTQHINQQANWVSIMPVSCLEDVIYFLQIFLVPRVWGPGPGVGPFTAEASMNGGMKAFVRLLSALVCKRRTLRDPLNAGPKECNAARGITRQIFDYLTGTLQGRFLILEALESGLIPSLIKANPTFFVLEDEEAMFEDAAADLFHRFSVYLVYPSILREVLRSIRGISDSCEVTLELKSKTLWTAWQELKGKALALKDVRRDLRAQGVYPLCAVGECSSLGISQCSGCSSAVYCSSVCQKSDWGKGHRTICRRHNQRCKTGLPTEFDLMDKDEQFINGIAREFITRQSARVTEVVRLHQNSSEHATDTTSSSENDGGGTRRRKTCVAVFDLNSSEIPSIDREGSFTLYCNQRELRERVGDRKIDDPHRVLESLWTRTPAEERSLIIVILVPKLRDVSLAMMARFETEY
ncbi:hypothetical protein PQX77_017783 [Marasmius sp. AFHP31]|nr:hypothetical protein PQX77_017783 [Marasmius sp. AFHP31]